ncbi:MAG: membrane protein insertase YidC [Gemmatimonadaceae bacterium]
MERRVVLAVVLAIGVLFLTPRLFRAPEQPVGAVTDSAKSEPVRTTPEATPQVPAPTQQPAEAIAPADTQRPRVDTTVVQTTEAAHLFQSQGASLEHVELLKYRSLNLQRTLARLDSRWDPLLSYSLVVPNDTLPLLHVPFARADLTNRRVSYRTAIGGWVVNLRYDVDTSGYVLHAAAEVTDSSGRAAGENVLLVVNLPRALESFEADVVADRQALTVAYKPAARGASQIGVRSLDPNERRLEPGPLTWVALKSKYFILGLIARDTTAAFAELQVTGLQQLERDYPVAQTAVIGRMRDGVFAFDVYAGPQDWDAMVAVGRDFVAANAYGGFMQPVVQPFATIVMRVLLWMHNALALHYGWVLLLFGVIVRIAMWPLNQVAMRSSMRMQELQPQLAEVQKRYKSDPQRMQQETMRLYKEHGMSPFSPLAGCFPILLSMPVLFALFFVFQSTIEFRGVPFLWLPDISLKDPLYIAPLLMGGSMFFTSWLSMRSMPPNPQTRVMTYVLPVMMTVLLANMASGLNLYWAAQNVASIPQQILISRERARARKPARPS